MFKNSGSGLYDESLGYQGEPPQPQGSQLRLQSEDPPTMVVFITVVDRLQGKPTAVHGEHLR